MGYSEQEKEIISASSKSKIVDYHIHTKLCHHAVGEISDYVKMGEERHLKEMGFSDHAPLPEPERIGITMLPEELPYYIEQVKEIGEHSLIPVKLGLEVDYPIRDTLDLKLIERSEFDYLIGSVHFIGEFGFDQSKFLDKWRKADIDKIYREYYSLLIKTAETGLFTTIGHMDLVKKFGFYPKEYPYDLIDDLIKVMRKNGTIYELNTSGRYKPIGKFYPDIELIKRMFAAGIDVTLGSDSHTPETVGRDLSEALDILRRVGYTRITQFSRMKKEYLSI